MTIPNPIPSHIAPLIEHFKDYLPMDAADIEMLLPRVVERKVKRRQFILQEGDVCQHYNFVVSGCFKIYKVDEKGTEHNIQFVTENDWATDIGSFHAEKPSELYLICDNDLSPGVFVTCGYLTFKVMIVMIASKILMIQKRVTIFASW
jgi:hypothetical protein